MNAVTPAEPAKLDHDQLRAECRALQDNGITLKQQAAEIGEAYGTFSSWVGGTYGGNTDKVAGSVAKWLQARRERAAMRSTMPEAPPFVETATATNLIALFTFAQSTPDIVVAAGGAGIGKTVTSRHYKATRPNVFIATMRPTTSGIHTMLAEIAEVMGVEERSANKLARAIGRRVHGTNALLIVDEAQHPQSSALDELRSLHDAWGIGIALVGNETVYSRLEGEGRKSSLAQLYSRVGMRLTQAKPRRQDVDALIAAWGITDSASVELLRKIAEKPGALRGLTKTLRLAHMLGGPDGPTTATIRDAWRQLGNLVLD